MLTGLLVHHVIVFWLCGGALDEVSASTHGGGSGGRGGGGEWVVDQATHLDSDAWPGRDWTQVTETKENRKATSWSPLGLLSSPEVFENEDESPTSGSQENGKSVTKPKKITEPDKPNSVNKLTKGHVTIPGRMRNPLGSKIGGKMSTTSLKDKLGPGMGGSAIRGFDDSKQQKFATEPAPQTAVVGTIVVLPCRVINKVGKLQWTKNGFGLGTDRKLVGYARYTMIGADDEGDFSLRIQPVLLEDDGFFQCQVSASDGAPGIRSKSVQLTVYVPPEPPVVEPRVLKSTAGLMTTIQCVSKGGRPPPEIQWVDKSHPRDPLGLGAQTTTELMDDKKRSIVTSVLSFTPRRTHDNTSIACVTSHQALTAPLTGLANLEIEYAPEVQVEVSPDRLVEGDDAQLLCSAVANPPALKYRWYHNRMLVENASTATLALRKISRQMHQDSVSCEVSNKVGTSKKTQTLHVRFKPRFRSPPEDVAAELQNEVLLKCDVDSNPPASISWFQEGSDKVISRGPELRVVVTPSTTGSYKCVSTVRERDLSFPELVGHMRVLVKGPPTIVSAGEQMGSPGTTVHLECNTVSVPSPIRVTWTYRGRTVDLEDPRYEVKEQVREEGLQNILVIKDADDTDFGDYNCSVVNEYGIARKLIRLNEKTERIPLLLVYAGTGVLLFILIIVVFLLLCNRRAARDKAIQEKGQLSLNSRGPNMYSAGSDSRLTDQLTPNSGRAQSQDTLGGLEDSSNLVSDRLTRIREDTLRDRTKLFPEQSLREEESSGFLPLLDVARHDPSRRGSSSEIVSGVGNGTGGFMQTKGPGLSDGPLTSDFCTMRRMGPMTPNSKGPDLTEPFHNGHANGRNGGKEVSHLNGHDRYSSYGGYSGTPPPPPPYPRASAGGMKAPLGVSHLSQPGGVPSTQSGVVVEPSESVADTSYIFSPEAMLKPGTLV